jgi:hypothetical protein
MPDITKLNPFLEAEEFKELNPLNFSAADFASKKAVVEEEDDGDEGGGGITLSIEQLNAYLLACFTKERRQGQRKFGPIPFTEDPNRLLGKKGRRSGSICGELPHAHPLLAQSQQFSGDDPKLTAIPLDNPKARERYPELRLENQLRQNPGLGRRKSVTLSR